MPDQTSPPTVRVVRVLEALAAEPGTAQPLSALARNLDLSPATVLRILHELVETGYVVRHNDRTYRLGPAVAALGRAAGSASPALPLLHEVVRDLSRTLGAPCATATVAGDQIVVVDVATPPGRAEAVRVGARFPFRAPAGMSLASWRSDDEVDKWLADAMIDLPDEAVTHAWQIVAAARSTGHLTRRLSEAERALDHLVRTSVGARSEDLAQLLALAVLPFTQSEYLEPSGTGTYSVATISVPVFNDLAVPEHVVTLHVENPVVKGSTLRRMITTVRAACERATKDLGGRNPFGDT